MQSDERTNDFNRTPEPTLANNIELIARGLLIEEGRVLLCVNRKHGYAFLPGGHVEFGESAEDALAREFFEECGVAVRVGRLMLTHEHRFHRASGPRHEVNLVFHVERVGEHGVVVSREPKIDFRRIEIAQISEVSIRPASMARWIQTPTPAWFSESSQA